MEDQAPAQTAIRFGPFELFVETGELRKDGVRLKLSGQPIQILTRLVTNPGKPAKGFALDIPRISQGFPIQREQNSR